MDYSIGDFFSSVIKLFALLTPPAALSAFLSGTQTYGGRRKRRTALRTGTAVFIVGTVLYFFGESLFSVFGFTLDAFRIGAGALLFLTSVALMGEQRESHTPDSPDEDISVVPLAIPICMGPASIGTLMVLGASAHSMTERIIGSAALFVASALITLMLLMANHVQRILGKFIIMGDGARHLVHHPVVGGVNFGEFILLLLSVENGDIKGKHIHILHTRDINAYTIYSYVCFGDVVPYFDYSQEGLAGHPGCILEVPVFGLWKV